MEGSSGQKRRLLLTLAASLLENRTHVRWGVKGDFQRPALRWPMSHERRNTLVVSLIAPGREENTRGVLREFLWSLFPLKERALRSNKKATD